jgi:hypothetical protein
MLPSFVSGAARILVCGITDRNFGVWFQYRMSPYISKRAAECEHLMEAETDLVRKAAFRLLRDMWLALADVAPSMDQGELERETAAVDQIHVNFLLGDRRH